MVGDGDFASNAQIGAYGNRALALALLAWLSDPGDLTVLPPDPSTPDALVLDEQQRLRIGLGSLVLLPALFLVIGLGIRWLRWRGHEVALDHQPGPDPGPRGARLGRFGTSSP